MTQRFEDWLDASSRRLHAYVLAKATLTVLLLLLLRALRDKDAVVVYLRF